MIKFFRLQPLALFALFMGVVFALLVLAGESRMLAPLTGLCILAVISYFSLLNRPRGSAAAVGADAQTAPGNIRVEKLIDALPDPCLILDARGAVFAFNGKASRIVPGVTKNAPLTFHLRWPALSAAIDKALNGETVTVDIEEKVPIERWYHMFLAPFAPGDSEKTEFVCVTIHELTHQKRAERMRVDFVANASHELRTPLASLLGFVETLQGPARDDEKGRAHFLSIMQRQAQRMSRLIDDLLSLSRIEMHAHIQPDTPLDVSALLASTIDGLTPLAEDRDVTMRLQAAPGLMVRGDRDELTRAFENLIENAIKYGDSGKKVDVSVHASKLPNKMLSVEIRDYGEGIAEEHLQRLTERFYRVDETASKEKGGTGLGLAIVKHILNRHRGQLEIGSRIGQGSVFTALLPQWTDPDLA